MRVRFTCVLSRSADRLRGVSVGTWRHHEVAFLIRFKHRRGATCSGSSLEWATDRQTDNLTQIRPVARLWLSVSEYWISQIAFSLSVGMTSLIYALRSVTHLWGNVWLAGSNTTRRPFRGRHSFSVSGKESSWFQATLKLPKTCEFLLAFIWDIVARYN